MQMNKFFHSPVIAGNLRYVCPFCITSHLLLVSELRSEISHLKARVIRLENACCHDNKFKYSLDYNYREMPVTHWQCYHQNIYHLSIDNRKRGNIVVTM